MAPAVSLVRDGQSAAPGHGPARSTKSNPQKRRDQIPSFSTTASRDIPSTRWAAANRRRLIVSDFSRYAVSRSEAISRQSSIGTITAVGSPASLETIWMSESDIISVYSPRAPERIHTSRCQPRVLFINVQRSLISPVLSTTYPNEPAPATSRSVITGSNASSNRIPPQPLRHRLPLRLHHLPSLRQPPP